MFCRLAAQEYSLIAPVLSQANVRLVGVGLEPLGVEEFVEQKFWAGGEISIASICFKLTKHSLFFFQNYTLMKIRKHLKH